MYVRPTQPSAHQQPIDERRELFDRRHARERRMSGILTASSSPLQGTGIITKGPYVRNCTNFIPNSIGAKIDGFNTEEGDKLNTTGVQRSFNVDSYTQFNQGGIGVSVTNGAYCQLVSIFTICDDIAIYACPCGFTRNPCISTRDSTAGRIQQE